MKILIFTEGTILMHKSAAGHTREEIVRQVTEKDHSVKDYSSYIPIGNSPKKITKWKQQGAKIFYLASRRKPEQIKDIKNVLKRYNFPDGELLFRKEGEEYKDVAETMIPDVFIEDDCESIGRDEITYPHIKPKIQDKIHPIIVKEFAGIDKLPNDMKELNKF